MRTALLLLAFGTLAGALAPAPRANATEAPAYRVVAEEANEAKRIVSVRLEHRLPELELGRIAEAVRARQAQPVPRTLVQFYLASARPGGVPWATATLAPDLRLVVNGLNADEEALLLVEARRETRDVVGAWLTEPPAAPGSLLIVRDKGRLTAEWRLRGGHRTVDEVTESRWNGGHRYDIRGGDGQHYVVTRAGTLELRDKSSLISVAEPMKLQAPQPHVAHSPAAPTNPSPKDVAKSAAAGSSPSSPTLAAPIFGGNAGQPQGAFEKPLMAPAPSSATRSAAAAASPPVALPAAPQAPQAVASDVQASTETAAEAPAPVADAISKVSSRKQASAKPHTPRAKPSTAGPARAKSGSDQSVAALMAAKLGQ